MPLTRGVNLGLVLDTRVGERALLDLRPDHLDAVAAAGFDTVRLPVHWSAHVDPHPPHAVDPALLRRVDAVLDQAAARGLFVVLDVHHEDELARDPGRHGDRFLGLWEHLVQHFGRRPVDQLAFELLNEPRWALTAERWNTLLSSALTVVRRTDPERQVLVGPVHQNAIQALDRLQLPHDDRLVVTVHYYEPMAFTHQSAHWVAGADRWRGTGWGSVDDRLTVRRDLRFAADWAARRGLPLFVGEFGAYEAAGMPARVAWTAAVRAATEDVGAGWCYWSLAGDFGILDPADGRWRQPLAGAVLEG